MIAFKDLKSDEVTRVCVFSACGHLGALKPHNWVVNILIENHNKLGISGYNYLLFQYSWGESMEDARRIFHKMVTREVVSYYMLITRLTLHSPLIEEGEKDLKEINWDLLFGIMYFTSLVWILMGSWLKPLQWHLYLVILILNICVSWDNPWQKRNVTVCDSWTSRYWSDYDASK